MAERYTLYGAELSLYSGKVRSYLRKKGLPFTEVAATRKVYKNTIIPKTGVRYIPVVETPSGQFLQDTSIIIEALEKQHPVHPVVPATPRQRFIARLLELYADEWLVIPAMHYRWNFPDQNQPFIYQEFGRFVLPWAPAWLRGRVGEKAGAMFKASVERLGVTEKSIPAVERSYEALLNDLNGHFGQHQFVLGGKPSLADFGLIGPLYAHLYRDPYPGRLMRSVAPNVAAWVERMMSPEPLLQCGDCLHDDVIPMTLEPIIARFAREQWPVLKATNEALTEWAKTNSQAQVPRTIGKHSFVIEGVESQRIVLPYSLWMLQEVLSHPESKDLASDAHFVQWLDKHGLADILGFQVNTPMQRINNLLYLIHPTEN